jgi:hypothetical protein
MNDEPLHIYLINTTSITLDVMSLFTRCVRDNVNPIIKK